MKRLKLLFVAVVIMLCLAAGTLAGHTRPGGGWCKGECVGSHCNACDMPCGGAPVGNKTRKRSTPRSSGDVGAFVLFGLVVFISKRRLL